MVNHATPSTATAAPTGVVWLDGQLIPAATAQVGLFTHGLHYGTVVFDGCRFYAGADGNIAIFRLDDHLRRFRAGVRGLYAELAVDDATLRAACLDVVRGAGTRNGYLRQMAFFGEGTMGLGAQTPLRIAVMAWPKAVTAATAVSLRVASFGHGRGWMPSVKLGGHYARAFLAKREAAATGVDDAVFLDEQGHIAEASAANVFAMLDGVLCTPPLTSPILHGITRASVLTLAADAGIATREVAFPRDALIAADEAFLVSSGSELQPIRQFEGYALPAPGPITTQLSTALARVLRGDDPRHAAWNAWVTPASEPAA